MRKFSGSHFLFILAAIFLFKIAIADTFRANQKDKTVINVDLIK